MHSVVPALVRVPVLGHLLIPIAYSINIIKDQQQRFNCFYYYPILNYGENFRLFRINVSNPLRT